MSTTFVPMDEDDHDDVVASPISQEENQDQASPEDQRHSQDQSAQGATLIPPQLSPLNGPNSSVDLSTPRSLAEVGIGEGELTPRSWGVKTDPGDAPEFDNKEFYKKMLAASLGSILEWYDFALFGGLAAVIGDVFFPGDDPDAKLMESLAVFGAAFVMRPIGGLAVGYVGDKIGRKPALQLSIVLMMVPSFLIGCLPTYAQAGYVATLLLCLLRLIQGLAVGGELVSAYVFCIESAPDAKKLFWGAVTLDAAMLGTLLGTGTAAIFKTAMSEEFLYSVGWRMGFWLGIIAGLAGVMLRRGIGDTHEAPENATETFASHARYTCTNHGPDLLVVAAVSGIWCTGFYQSFVWMPYLLGDDILDTAIEGGETINTCMFALCMFLFLPIGWEASGWNNGAIKLIRIGTTGLMFCALPCYWLINLRTWYGAVLAQLVLGIFVACIGAAAPYFLIYSFPPRIRTFGVGISYNLSQAVFGGVTPVMSSALAKSHPVLPAVWLMTVAVISTLALCVYEARMSKQLLAPGVDMQPGPGQDGLDVELDEMDQKRGL